MTTGQEREGKDFMKKHMADVQAQRDGKKRDGDAEIAAAAKYGSTWVHKRARGRKVFFV